MRDLFMLAILPVLLYAMAKRPFVAIGMWVWTALFFPNGWVYGMASGIRYNLLFTGVAVLAYLAMKNKPRVHFGLLGGMVMLFFLWTTIGTTVTIGNPDVAWEFWGRFAKIILLFVFVLLVVEKKLHVDFILWCVVLSVGFYANLEGLKFIATGGGHQIAGMETHVLHDRNELAVAFVMTLPICYYLMHEYGRHSRLVRLGLMATIALLVISVIGTQSRGGFIALVVVGGYFFIKSDRKVLVGAAIAVLAMIVMQLASDDWVERINTIESADEDGSFLSRLVAWKLSFILATEHPFFGGGFRAIQHLPTWADLSQRFFSYPWFYTGDLLPNPTYARAAHSVYFQVLGDHGFVGLGMYLAILAVAFFKTGSIARRARLTDAHGWIPLLATMLQLSIFSFALGGAALSFAYFDLIFALFGLVVILEKRLLAVAAPRSPTGPALASSAPIPSRKMHEPS